MNLSGKHAAAVILLAFVVRPAPILAQKVGSGATASADDASTSAVASVPSAEGDADAAENEDWVAFAKTQQPFGRDRMVGEATLFDTKSGAVVRSLRRYGDTLRHVRFSPDGTCAVLGFYGRCVLWNVDSGDVTREFDQGGIAHFSPDGSSILIYGEHRATRYEVASGKALETIQLPGGRGFKGRYTKINAHIANEEQHDASGSLVYNSDASTMQPIVDAATGKNVGQCPSNTRGCLVSGATSRVLHGGPLHPMNVVRVFDFEQHEVGRFDMPVGSVKGLGGELKAVSRDGKRFLYARPAEADGENPGPRALFRTRRYSVHDVATGKEVSALGNFDAYYSAHFSPDASVVVMLPTFGHEADDPRDPEILVIDAATGTVNRRIYSGPWALPSLDFDTDGRRMLVAGAMNLEFWRRPAPWHRWESQSPMPRKVVDTLRILKKGLGSDAAEPEATPSSDRKGDGA